MLQNGLVEGSVDETKWGRSCRCCIINSLVFIEDNVIFITYCLIEYLSRTHQCTCIRATVIKDVAQSITVAVWGFSLTGSHNTAATVASSRAGTFKVCQDVNSIINIIIITMTGYMCFLITLDVFRLLCTGSTISLI